MTTYGIALIEKPGEDGLDKEDLQLLYGLVSGIYSNGSTQVYPIELSAREHESSAMGFITPKAAETLDFDYETSGLHDFVASILDDMEKERKDKHYQFKGIDIYLSR